MLLHRLGVEFDIFSPDVDERALENELADQLVARLAREKAGVISAVNPAAVVIGSDQLALFEDQILGKPGNVERAVSQLARFSGKNVQFLTAVSVQCQQSGFESAALIVTKVRFRTLTDSEIQRYVQFDQPLDCAGGFKSEAAGISLLESMQSEDPTAIIGLPLIALSALLRQAGLIFP